MNIYYIPLFHLHPGILTQNSRLPVNAVADKLGQTAHGQQLSTKTKNTTCIWVVMNHYKNIYTSEQKKSGIYVLFYLFLGIEAYSVQITYNILLKHNLLFVREVSGLE